MTSLSAYPGGPVVLRPSGAVATVLSTEFDTRTYWGYQLPGHAWHGSPLAAPNLIAAGRSARRLAVLYAAQDGVFARILEIP
jgi:hypothetical protein